MKETLLRRRTIRFYKQVDVARKDLEDLIDVARTTSSASNSQLLRYIVVHTPQLAQEVFKHTAWAALVKPNRTPVWGVSAPRTFIAVIAPVDAKPITFADAGAAIQSMQALATHKGLGCCWLGAINRQRLKEIFKLNDAQQVLFLLAIGVPDEKPVSEDVDSPDKVDYYLDDKNVLHVPKLDAKSVATWR